MADLIDNRLSPSGQEPAVLSNREEGRASYKLGRRAIVVGAGIGGLSAAGALVKSFDQVDVLERDDLATSAQSRSGTPQDRHPHGLLAGGLRALDRIFPDFKRDLGFVSKYLV
jgi:glycine/D-amino acid oxidase-like deaminating enzyme